MPVTRRNNKVNCTRNVTDGDGSEPVESQAPQSKRHKTNEMDAMTLHMALEDHDLRNDVPDELLEACQKGDVLLVCKDNKAVQCHSQILAVASPVLAGLFECIQGSDTTLQVSHNTSPKRVPVIEDDAREWLFALLYLYPLGCASPRLPFEMVKALAVLGHKYNIRALLKVAKERMDNIVYDASNAWFHRCIFKNWTPYKMSSENFRAPSETFKAGQYHWYVSLQKSCRNGKEGLGAFLLCAKGPEALWGTCNVQYRVALVHRTDPSNKTIASRVCKTTPQEVKEGGGRGWSHLVEWNKLKSEGYVVDSSAEFVVMVKEEQSEEQSKHSLSIDPEHDMYVFHWLDIAVLVNHKELQDKCLQCIKDNVLFSMFDKKFREDMHRSVQSCCLG